MKKYFIHIFVAILILSSAFPTFSVSALSNPSIIEPEPQILRDEQVRLESELTEEVKLRLQNRTEPIEERVQVAPTAEQIAQTQAQVQSFMCTNTMDVPMTECEALVALYESTNGAGWASSVNWLTGSAVKEWKGVFIADGHVSGIILTFNNLNGNIPPELGDLSNLQTLALSSNLLTGIIPIELAKLTNLQTLVLSSNQLTGGIPIELDKLTYLFALSLEGNQLTGGIPIELDKLINLKYLYLARNQLRGSIPPELGNLTNLVHLYLEDNQLSGSIPAELGDLFILENLGLADNQLSGSIPPELGKLTNLVYLSLQGNELTGSIPLSFVNLKNLSVFYFNHTHLCEPTDVVAFQDWKAARGLWDGTGVSCKSTSSCAGVSEIPLVQCEALVTLYNSTSGPEWLGISALWFTTTTVSSWGGVTVTGSNVTGLNLTNKQLIGNIPPELGNLTKLQTLRLSYNQLTGSIPAELGSLSNLIVLYLYSNQLSGSIPPEVGMLSSLEDLDLGANQLSGSIPAEMGNLGKLKILWMGDNQLSGSIPPSVGKLSSLEDLDLGLNDLSGSIPVEMGNLGKLKILWMGDNQLSGSLPAKLGDLFALQSFDLSYNQLTGSIPLSFVNLTNLVVFFFNDTNLCEPADETFQKLMDDLVLNWFGTGLPCHAPVAMADKYSTPEDSELVVTAMEGVLFNDSDEDWDALTAELVSTVDDGSLVLVADGSFTYKPDLDFNGEDSFTYKVFDSVEYSGVITVTIMVNQALYSIYYFPLIIK